MQLAPAGKSPYFSLAENFTSRGEIIRAIECIMLHLNISPRDVLAILWLAELAIEQKHEIYAEKQLVKAGQANKRAKKNTVKSRKLEMRINSFF